MTRHFEASKRKSQEESFTKLFKFPKMYHSQNYEIYIIFSISIQYTKLSLLNYIHEKKKNHDIVRRKGVVSPRRDQTVIIKKINTFVPSFRSRIISITS